MRKYGNIFWGMFILSHEVSTAPHLSANNASDQARRHRFELLRRKISIGSLILSHPFKPTVMTSNCKKLTRILMLEWHYKWSLCKMFSLLDIDDIGTIKTAYISASEHRSDFAQELEFCLKAIPQDDHSEVNSDRNLTILSLSRLSEVLVSITGSGGSRSAISSRVHQCQ